MLLLLPALLLPALPTAPRGLYANASEDMPKTFEERMLGMAHVLKNHFSDRSGVMDIAMGAISTLHQSAGKFDIALDAGSSVNAKTTNLDVTAINRAVSAISEIMGPAAAAQAGLEFTSQDANKLVGEAGASHRELEEGGKEGMEGELERKAHEGDILEQQPRFAPRALSNADVALYTAGVGAPWEDGIVNYCFANDMKARTREVVGQAIKQMKKVMPCIEWRNVGRKSDNLCNESPAVYMTSEDSSGCWAHIGQVRPVWPYLLDCRHLPFVRKLNRLPPCSTVRYPAESAAGGRGDARAGA